MELPEPMGVRSEELPSEVTTMFDIETDVLIIGSGPAGGASAALLSSYGIPNIMIEKYGWLANTPRAHITNQRTMEVIRELGLEEEAKEKAVPQELMGNNVFCTSLAGEEIGRLLTWGNHPSRKADYDLASPTRSATSHRLCWSRSLSATPWPTARSPGSRPSTSAICRMATA